YHPPFFFARRDRVLLGFPEGHVQGNPVPLCNLLEELKVRLLQNELVPWHWRVREVTERDADREIGERGVRW
ncbi:hypothetical protein Ancab_035675, partial [Ancistrocladus abbreviatus]